MAKLTGEELRIIERTKQQGRDQNTPAQNGKQPTKYPKWAPVRSALLFMFFFALLVFFAYLLISNTAR